MDPCSAELTPTDEQLVAFRLVDANQPVEALCAQAMAKRAGAPRTGGILAVIQDGTLEGRESRPLPAVVEARAIEGVFGAGRTTTWSSANRLDVAVQAAGT